jgi:hypothetical protein
MSDDFADIAFLVTVSPVGTDHPRPVVGVDGPVAGADVTYDHHATGEVVNLLAVPARVRRPGTLATTMLDADAVLSAALVLLRSGGEEDAIQAVWPPLFETAHLCDHLVPSGRYPAAERAGLGLYCWLKDRGFAGEGSRASVFRTLTLAMVAAIREGVLPFDLGYLERLDRMEHEARAAIQKIAGRVTLLSPEAYVDPLALYRVVDTDLSLIMVPREDGATGYHVGVHPRAYSRIDLRPTLAALAAREAGWGGRSNTGGSPLEAGSRLPVTEVLAALQAPDA